MFLVNGTANPYIQAMSMMGSSPALTNAILAIAACHCAHGVTGSPLMPLFDGARMQRLPSTSPSQAATSPTTTANPIPSSSLSHSDLLNQYLRLKHTSLRHLSADLGTPHGLREGATLATVLFLALLELMETGAGFWSVHVEGAKKLLEGGIGNGTKSGAALLKPLINELIL